MKFGGRGLAAGFFKRRLNPVATARGTDSAAAARARFANQFEIRKLLAHMERAYSHFSVIALYSIDDSNRTERTQPNPIPDLERTRFTGSAGVPPAFFFRPNLPYLT